MIYFSFCLRPPSLKYEIIKVINGLSFIPNKMWELQINKVNYILSFDFEITAKQSHAGLFLAIGLFGREVIFNLYDRRHWNPKTNNWENDNEQRIC